MITQDSFDRLFNIAQERIKDIVEVKRSGNFAKADEMYHKLEIDFFENIHYFPLIYKSWAKIKVCLGEYDAAITMLKTASKDYLSMGQDLQIEHEQCEHHINMIASRNSDRSAFVQYVQSVSGGALSYPSNF